MLINKVGKKRGRVISSSQTKGMALTRLYLKIHINQIIDINITFQVCGDDQPCCGKDDEEMIKLDEPSSGKKEGMLKVRLKI